MQPNLFPFGTALGNPFLFNGDLSEAGFESSRIFFLVPFLLSQGGGMDLSKVGEKILSSVRSARSLGILPSTSERPEVPARAAAAAVVARALAGLPPHQRFSISSSSTELSSIYGNRPHGEDIMELEDDFYEEDFDPVRHVLEHIPSDDNELAFFEKQATLRLAQLDIVSERLSRHVMEHHEAMVKGMNLVRELEKDLQVANVICMNGRRHLTSSKNEVSRDLIVHASSKKKQAFLNVLPLLSELLHALDMQNALESLTDQGDYCKAFQVLSEYLQLLDGFSELSAIKEMGKGVEVWLGRTLHKLDSLLLGVCQEFKGQSYLTVIDAYALIGDISGLAEKIQSFFMQEVLSETHSVLKSIILEDQEPNQQIVRLTYSDLCHQIPESRFRHSLLQTLAVLFKLMCSYYEIMSYQLENEENDVGRSSSLKQTESDISHPSKEANHTDSFAKVVNPIGSHTSTSPNTISSSYVSEDPSTTTSRLDSPSTSGFAHMDSQISDRNNSSAETSSGSPWYYLRKDATTFVSQTLQRGRKNLWQLTTSRVSVLLSSASVGSTSMHQFLRIYEDLTVFILAGEAFCGFEAVEFRNKLKAVCENYFAAFHRQNISALKMVLEKEHWMRLPPETAHVIAFAGLVGDGAALIAPTGTNPGPLHSDESMNSTDAASRKSVFSHWLINGNVFLQKLGSRECQTPTMHNGGSSEFHGKNDHIHDDRNSPRSGDANHRNGYSPSEEENEDLLADFIDEDSQLPSRIAKPKLPKSHALANGDQNLTGSSLSLLRAMDKYARLMQKLEIVNVEFFKGMCQLFELFYYFVYETFSEQNVSSGKGYNDSLNYRLKTSLSRIAQDCDQWIKPQSFTGTSYPPTSLNDVTPISPSTSFGLISGASLGLKERCTGADTLSLVAQMLHKSKAHIQSMLLRNNAGIVDNFYSQMVDSVPDLIQHIHRTTARQLLHMNGYIDRIANAKWEIKDLGLEHNGYVDLLLGEFKHYKTRLTHGGIHKEVQNTLLEYGLAIVAETLIEGLSRVKRCTDEGRALMSLDLQVLINGLQNFVSTDAKPEFQIVETFIKAYYLPETEYVHWVRAHPEYTKSQMMGLINLVATMRGWRRKTRLEILEKIE